MGLDVYMYRYLGDQAAIHAAEKAFETATDALYAEDLNLDSDQRSAERQRIAATEPFAAFQLGEWGESALKEEIRETPTTYPDNICQIGYFRSSYNSSGMNSRLRDAVGKDLYWIFDVADDHGYHVVPDWEQALERVKQVNEEVSTLIGQYGNIEIMEFSPNMFADPSKLVGSVAEAAAIYKEHYNKQKASDPNRFIGNDYSNGQGTFMFDNPLTTVKAIFPGCRKGFLSDRLEPCTYIVVESAGDAGGLQWAIQSLAVVQETIEWVLAREDRSSYVLHWSA